MSKKNPLNNYAKYSSIAFQMGLTVFGLTYLGVKLDEYLKLDFPIFTVILSLVSVAIAMYNSIRDFINMGNNKNK